MSTETPTTGDLHIVVGYDGSPPAVRALDAAVRLLRGRTGSIEVVYIAHLPAVDMLSADAIAGVEDSFDEVSRDLHAQAREQLRGREDRWVFARGDGAVPDVLIATAARLRDQYPADTVAILVGSSSQAMHRVVGSVAVSLARHADVPIMIVP
jgi:nucleotide-binding universal stress UspA family protein